MTIRKTPKQTRSVQRVDAILDAAAGLFSEVGYEAATTNEIATRAGVPIGSLYQYFESKEAILNALVERFVEAMRGVSRDLLNEARVKSIPLYALIGALIDGIAAFDRQNAGFHAMFVTTGASSQLAQATAALHAETVGQVEALIGVRFPDLSSDRRHLCARVSVAMVKGLMALPGAPDYVEPAAALTEAKAALLAYIRDFLAREGLSIPPDLTPPS